MKPDNSPGTAASANTMLPREQAQFRGWWKKLPMLTASATTLLLVVLLFLLWRHGHMLLDSPYVRLLPAEVITLRSPIDGVFAAAPRPSGSTVTNGEYLGRVNSEQHAQALSQTRQLLRQLTSEVLWLDENLTQANTRQSRDQIEEQILQKVSLRESAMERRRELETYDQQCVIRSPVNGRLVSTMVLTKEVKADMEVAGIVPETNRYFLEIHAPITIAAQLLKRGVVTAKFDTPEGSRSVTARTVPGSFSAYVRQDWNHPPEAWAQFSTVAAQSPTFLAPLSHFGRIALWQDTLPIELQQPTTAMSPSSSHLEAATADELLAQHLRFAGLVIPAWTLDICAEAEGKLDELRASRGDHLAKDQELGEIDPREAEAACQSQQQRMAQAAAELDSARHNLAGGEEHSAADKRLADSGGLATLDYQDRMHGTEQSAAAVKAAEARLRLAESELERLTVTRQRHRLCAPAAGVVEWVNFTRGEFLEASTPVARLRSEELRVKLLLPEVRPEWRSAMRFQLVGDPRELVPLWEQQRPVGAGLWTLQLSLPQSLRRENLTSVEIEVHFETNGLDHERIASLTNLAGLLRVF